MRHILTPVIAAVFLLAHCGNTLFAQVKVGDTPNFAFKTLDGTAVSAANLRGRIVILDFWATWCGPCMAMAPRMVELNKRYRDKGVLIIGISLDQDLAKLKQVIKEKGFTWPQSCDRKAGDSPIVKQFGVTGIPYIAILTPEGKVAWTGHPMQMDKPLAQIVENNPTNLTPEQKVEEAVKRVKDAGEKVSGETKDYAAALERIQEIPSALLREEAVVAVAAPVVDAFQLKGTPEELKPIREARRNNTEGNRALDALTRAVTAARRRAEREKSKEPPAATQPAPAPAPSNDEGKDTAGDDDTP